MRFKLAAKRLTGLVGTGFNATNATTGKRLRLSTALPKASTGTLDFRGKNSYTFWSYEKENNQIDSRRSKSITEPARGKREKRVVFGKSRTLLESTQTHFDGTWWVYSLKIILFEAMREKTNKLLEMIENEEISKDTVIMACVKYMSEDDVADMMEHNEMIEPEES
jgi:hypothetical protein